MLVTPAQRHPNRTPNPYLSHTPSPCTTPDMAPDPRNTDSSMNVDLSSTTGKLRLIVEGDLDLLQLGKISQLLAQTELLMEQRVSRSGSGSSASSDDQPTTLSPLVTPLLFAQVTATPKPPNLVHTYDCCVLSAGSYLLLLCVLLDRY